MFRKITVNLGNLILSLSEAIDLADPQLIQHQQKTAFIVWEMAKIANLSDERISQLFIAALLHDIGAFSLEEKIAMKNFEIDNIESHCIKGEALLKKIPWFVDAALIIRNHHRDWSRWDEPIEDSFVFDSQLLYLADYVERRINREVYILHQKDKILDEIKNISGSLIHPIVVDLFFTVSYREEFWLDLSNRRLYSVLLNEGPFKGKEIAFSELALISELFRNIIDFRSRFTSTHSSGVAAAASFLSKIFGFTEKEVELMYVAGNLHDLGKLAIPNTILDKPGKLNSEEMAIMKSHTYYTYNIINTIGGLNQVAEWAAYHHERLDASGYPFHCKSEELCLGARIMMVADIFTALIEDRPYRKSLPKNKVVEIISDMARESLLDKKVVKLLFENYEEIHAYVTEQQSRAKEFYEKQFTDNLQYQ